jgi:hypothetical protein
MLGFAEGKAMATKHDVLLVVMFRDSSETSHCMSQTVSLPFIPFPGLSIESDSTLFEGFAVTITNVSWHRHDERFTADCVVGRDVDSSDFVEVEFMEAHGWEG